MSRILVDLDGVVANCNDRLKYIQKVPKDYAQFYSEENMMNDTPYPEFLEFIKDLMQSISFVTGRPERTRQTTMNWLQLNGFTMMDGDELLMRSDGDYRPSSVVKEELIGKLDKEDILFAIDDQKDNCDMYERLGINVMRVTNPK